MLTFDDIDKKLLALLQQDAKTNIKTLASTLNLTKTPIYERIRRYEREGIIDRYVAILDRRKLAPTMVIFCFVSLESQKLEEIQCFSEAVQELNEVLECYLLGGSNDFLLKVVVSDLNAYHQFSSGKLAALANIRQIKSTFVIHEVKYDTVYPVD